MPIQCCVEIFARPFFLKYKQSLTGKPDERMNQTISLGVMEKLLKKSFEETSHNLREGHRSILQYLQRASRKHPGINP